MGSSTSIELNQLLPTLSELNQLPKEELRALYTKLSGDPAPKHVRRTLLRDNITWMLQVVQSGDCPIKVNAQLAKLVKNSTTSTKNRYLPGTRLIREWHGITHEVVIEDNGYSWKSKQYRSLSKIAQEITGTHWSGPRFFGLKGTSITENNKGGRT